MSNFHYYFKILRISHYFKNLIIFAPLFFGLKIFQLDLFLKTVFVFIAFSFAASAVYIFNDYFDLKEDSQHPKKKNRPLASGEISRASALFLMIILFILGLAMAFFLDKRAFYLILAYILLNVFYTIKLKHFPIVDVGIVSFGFLIRLFVGSVVAGVPLSMWIIIMTFLLAIFLALAKRRDDVLLYLSNGVVARKAVDGYNLEFLNASMVIMASVIIVAYIMYTISPTGIVKIHSDNLYLTTIFVIFGILRYLQITFVENKSGDPTEIFLKDKFIQLTVLTWVITFGILLYFYNDYPSY